MNGSKLRGGTVSPMEKESTGGARGHKCGADSLSRRWPAIWKNEPKKDSNYCETRRERERETSQERVYIWMPEQKDSSLLSTQ